ncbi:MAG: RecQ family ATP-dependent DNA helicase [Aerococcus sp.]|nr:RecQ family ATP-dependent DNA helicase [Aerococcus sp.]
MCDYEQQLEALYGSEAVFKPGQLPALEALEQGENVIALLPTGGGKSLIYQLFHYQKEGLAVIVSPLVALMQDQVAQLQMLGIKQVVALNSTLNHDEQQDVLDQLESYRYLFLSPEMIDRPEIIHRLTQQSISVLVVDEAHCISQWGFDFRVEYSELINVRRHLNHPLTLALTATATEKTLADIQKFLFYPFETVKTIRVSLDRPNIFYATKAVDEERKPVTLAEDLKQLPKPGIVYVHQKAEAEALQAELRAKTDLSVATYHADHRPEDRYSTQQQFLHGELDVILATSAFGMGINQGNIRFVIHYHLPFTMAEIIQEIGRCGRDGQQAYGLTYYNDEEFSRLSYFMTDQYPLEKPFYGMLVHTFKHHSAEFLEAEGTDEQVISLLNFYQRHFASPAQAIAHYRQFLIVKQQEVRKVIHYCQTPQCLRQYLLSSFDEALAVKPAFCCKNDQANYQESETWLSYLNSGQVSLHLQHDLPHWRERLASLLG